MIPRGVWHAERCIGGKDAMVVNFPTIQYDHTNPDKYRLPLDTTSCRSISGRAGTAGSAATARGAPGREALDPVHRCAGLLVLAHHLIQGAPTQGTLQ